MIDPLSAGAMLTAATSLVSFIVKRFYDRKRNTITSNLREEKKALNNQLEMLDSLKKSLESQALVAKVQTAQAEATKAQMEAELKKLELLQKLNELDLKLTYGEDGVMIIGPKGAKLEADPARPLTEEQINRVTE